ncbi:hypothetical protein MRX96_000515 [Rhipicephalus microplus]
MPGPPDSARTAATELRRDCHQEPSFLLACWHILVVTIGHCRHSFPRHVSLMRSLLIADTATLVASPALLGGELLERSLRLALGPFFATALLVDGFWSSGSGASAFFRDFRATVVARGVGASGSTTTAFGGQPRGRLAAGASFAGPAPLSVEAAAALRLACRPAFGGFSSASACFFGMAAWLQVPSHHQSSTTCSPLSPSALPLTGASYPCPASHGSYDLFQKRLFEAYLALTRIPPRR